MTPTTSATRSTPGSPTPSGRSIYCAGGGGGGHHSPHDPDQGGELIAMAGRTMDAGLHLLDRQLVDCDGRLAGKVDDLELELPEGGGPPLVTAILAGPGALGRRLGGRFGAWLEAVANRLRDGDDDHPARVPFAVVKQIGSAIDRIVGKLPGANDAPE